MGTCSLAKVLEDVNSIGTREGHDFAKGGHVEERNIGAALELLIHLTNILQGP